MQKKVLSFSLLASGWLLSNSGKLFPRLTARLFFRLYTTPPARKPSGSQLKLRGRAVADKVTFSRYGFDSRPLQIATFRWGGPGKKVLLLHGWGSSGLGFEALTDALVKAGYEVISFDQPAHGASGGRRTTLIQWMHMLDQYLRHEGPVYAVVGHSIGALNAALTLARKEHPTPKLVLAGPPLSAPAFFQDSFEFFKIPLKVRSEVFGLVRTKYRDDLIGMDLHRYIGRIGAGQILLVYDERDELVRHAELQAYSESYPEMKTFPVKGDGHFRILKNRAVIEKILSFLGEELEKSARDGLMRVGEDDRAGI
jgi:pimeloyl-ACP methyl ester carboxylesterase